MKLYKLNPLWWIANRDDPEPPADKWPNSPQWLRKLRWAMRNPLHNFTFYVIGCADKDYKVVGEYSEHVFNPEGGWKTHTVVCGKWRLPFRSYISKDEKRKFYIGWRERGNFGIKLNV